ncbi:unnamed protein product [Brachionus calyciflorus]|uniref:HTH CENPB-type domain-containing protein n=1 Tax=Brachionus calyciflorus TaxID=104777 RepID=A0A813QVP9_9BILA|nr:unnamed protein product [Brachionus calyciflorus]
MSGRRYVRYNLAFKLKVIKFAESTSKNKASKAFKVSRKQISKWIANKQKIFDSPGRLTRARVRRDDTAMYPDLENELKAWILEQRLLGYVVDGKSIKKQALEISTRDHLNFRASNGWFSRFLKRSNFVLRRITTSGRDLPSNKFKPLIVIPRVNPLKNYEPPANVIVIYNKNGVFNQDMTLDGVLKRSIAPKIASKDLQKPTLVFDQATCHVTKKVNDYLTIKNINKIHIPKRLTNLLQPADVSWMRPLKRAYHERWQNWLINEERTITPAGNIRSPGYIQVINWISEIWDQLDSGIIRDSFDRCGITSSQIIDFHSQLQGFLEKNQINMIEDYDHADEIDGFVDDFVVCNWLTLRTQKMILFLIRNNFVFNCIVLSNLVFDS